MVRVPCTLLNCTPNMRYLMAMFDIIDIFHFTLPSTPRKDYHSVTAREAATREADSIPKSHKCKDAGTTPDPMPFVFQTELLL